MVGQEEDKFVNLLKTQLKLESELEIIKENIIMNHLEFNPVQAYKLFMSKSDNGRNITVKNLKQSFKILNVKLADSEA